MSDTEHVVGTDEFLENLHDIMVGGDGFFEVLPEQKAGFSMFMDNVVDYVRRYVVEHYQWNPAAHDHDDAE